jgi:hypothetical protein
MVYGLLKEEMAKEGGIHALQLRTRTPEEDEKANAKKSADSSAKNVSLNTPNGI